MHISHSLTRSRRTSDILECEDLSFPKKHTLVEVRCDQILMRTCIVRCSDSEFSLWPIFYTTVRGLTKFKTRRSLSDEYDSYTVTSRLDWREDEDLLFDSARSLGIYKFQLAGKWSKSEKISCQAILKNLHEPEMDVTLTISFQITAEIEIRKHMFCVVLRRRGLSAQ